MHGTYNIYLLKTSVFSTKDSLTNKLLLRKRNILQLLSSMVELLSAISVLKSTALYCS